MKSLLQSYGHLRRPAAEMGHFFIHLSIRNVLINSILINKNLICPHLGLEGVFGGVAERPFLRGGRGFVWLEQQIFCNVLPGREMCLYLQKIII